MQWNGVSGCEYHGESKETETITWSEFPDGGKVIAEQTHLRTPFFHGPFVSGISLI